MTQDKHDRFDQAFKNWAERPPQTAPPEAARQVIARLPERRGSWRWVASGWRLATVGAGLALLLVVSWMTLPGPTGSVPTSMEMSIPPLSDEVVLLWLDEDTPLYLTVAPPATGGGPQ